MTKNDNNFILAISSTPKFKKLIIEFELLKFLRPQITGKNTKNNNPIDEIIPAEL